MGFLENLEASIWRENPESNKEAKCYFCNNEALYTQPHKYQVIDVCKKHFTMDLTS